MDISKIIEYLRKNLLVLFVIPIILIGFIYIQYGDIFDGIILHHHNNLKFYQLHIQLAIFSGDFFQVPLRFLPQVTASIGYYSVTALYILFSLWILLFATSSYLQLSQRTGSKIGILVELFTIFTIYITSICPGLNLWLSIFGYFIITIVFIMLLLYWAYEIKTKQ